ncbi:DUF3520 domain-containing protein [Dysgonomonas sp. 25]|nr:von Willebrand factor type A domain-containing protein [Dysgonomonas sp. 25]NDV68277.1 DUF3520 domain-containing protein [Dysgonomonas sp. 25]
MKKALFLTCFLLCFFNLFAQQVTVTGTITDDVYNEPIIGCSIRIQGTTNATHSDIEGNYTLTANVGDVIEFFYVGYITQTVKIEAGKTVYNIVMKEEEHQLSEMIIIGYGTSATPTEQMLRLSDRINYDALAEEEYTQFGENKFKSTRKEPVSTFSADVDKASYSNVRRFIEMEVFPPRDAIRTEELINYFHYDYTQPTMDNPITMQAEIGQCPWNKHNLLCKIGLKTRDIPEKMLPPSNFVFLIDVSGSMEGPARLDLVKESMSMLADQMKEKDKVAIVVYAGNAGLVLPATSGKDKEKIKEALNKLTAGGSTAGGEGILLAYKIAKENFIEGGNNRIIICSDGDFNVGPSSSSDLKKLIAEEAKSGVLLSVLGYGMGNYKDNHMQALAQNGNGNHAYINNIAEAKRVLITEFAGTLYTVAKDVKLQVEFNPELIDSYRLIGYETRLLNNEDFDDDTKDAGDMGSGHTVTALYELKPADAITDNNKLLTVNMRYKDPQSDSSKLLSLPVSASSKNKNSTDFNFASSVAMFAQLIRDSEFKGNATYKDVINLAKASVGKDKHGYRKEFVRLVGKVDKMTSSGKKILYGNVEMNDDFETFYQEAEDGEEYMGMKDAQGNIIVPAKYTDVEYIKGGIFVVEHNDDKKGLYQYYSGEVTPLIYDDMEMIGVESIRTELNGKYGILDLYGKEILPPVYDDIEEYYRHLKVEQNDKYGIFDSKGKKLIPIEYDDIDRKYDFYIVEKNDKYGAYSKEGKKILPVSYDGIDDSNEHLIIEKNDKYGMVNKKGKIVIPLKFDEEPYEIAPGLYTVEINDKTGMISSSGKTIIPIQYEYIDEISRDIFEVNKENGKYGAYNSKGKKIAEEIYEDIDLLYRVDNSIETKNPQGILKVELYKDHDYKYGIIAATGKMIAPAKYWDIDDLTPDIYVVRNEAGKYGAYNSKGEMIAPEIYDDIELLNDTEERRDKNGLYGYIVVSEYKYGKGNVYGLISASGEVLLPTKYSDIEDERIYNELHAVGYIDEEPAIYLKIE